MSAVLVLTATIAALKWGYRLAVLAALALAVFAYIQVRNGAGASSDGSYAKDIQQALGGLKDLARTLHSPRASRGKLAPRP